MGRLDLGNSHSAAMGVGLSLTASRNRTQNMSPLKIAGSQMFTMSPKEQVIASSRNVGAGWGIPGYDLPTIEPDQAGPSFMQPKSKKVSNIEADAKRKQLIPSPSHYKLKTAIPWSEKSANQSPSVLPKSKRLSQIDIIELNNKKPERSSPSPHVYSPKTDLVMTKAGGGHVTLKA